MEEIGTGNLIDPVRVDINININVLPGFFSYFNILNVWFVPENEFLTFKIARQCKL